MCQWMKVRVYSLYSEALEICFFFSFIGECVERKNAVLSEGDEKVCFGTRERIRRVTFHLSASSWTYPPNAFAFTRGEKEIIVGLACRLNIYMYILCRSRLERLSEDVIFVKFILRFLCCLNSSRSPSIKPADESCLRRRIRRCRLLWMVCARWCRDRERLRCHRLQRRPRWALCCCAEHCGRGTSGRADCCCSCTCCRRACTWGSPAGRGCTWHEVSSSPCAWSGGGTRDRSTCVSPCHAPCGSSGPARRWPAVSSPGRDYCPVDPWRFGGLCSGRCYCSPPLNREKSRRSCTSSPCHKSLEKRRKERCAIFSFQRYSCIRINDHL